MVHQDAGLAIAAREGHAKLRATITPLVPSLSGGEQATNGLGRRFGRCPPPAAWSSEATAGRHAIQPFFADGPEM